MDLQTLMEWTKKMQNTENLRKHVRKDLRTGKPLDGDLTVCNNLLGEIRKRAFMVIEHTKKAERYMVDISEYLETLDKRGIVCPLIASPSAQADPTAPPPEPPSAKQMEPPAPEPPQPTAPAKKSKGKK